MRLAVEPTPPDPRWCPAVRPSSPSSCSSSLYLGSCERKHPAHPAHMHIALLPARPLPWISTFFSILAAGLEKKKNHEGYCWFAKSWYRKHLCFISASGYEGILLWGIGFLVILSKPSVYLDNCVTQAWYTHLFNSAVLCPVYCGTQKSLS